MTNVLLSKKKKSPTNFQNEQTSVPENGTVLFELRGHLKYKGVWTLGILYDQGPRGSPPLHHLLPGCLVL